MKDTTAKEPIIFWNRFDQVKPDADQEYLVCTPDGVIRVSYYNGDTWGYLNSVKEDVVYWSILPFVPF